MTLGKVIVGTVLVLWTVGSVAAYKELKEMKAERDSQKDQENQNV